jgi:hypothetical protein
VGTCPLEGQVWLLFVSILLLASGPTVVTKEDPAPQALNGKDKTVNAT